jgi:hypothetical protein
MVWSVSGTKSVGLIVIDSSSLAEFDSKSGGLMAMDSIWSVLLLVPNMVVK